MAAMEMDEFYLLNGKRATRAPLKLALVTETYPPEVNGVAMTLGRLVEGLRQRGHRLQLIRPRRYLGDVPIRHREFREHLVTGVPIPGYRGLRWGLPAGAALARLWAVERPDVVHIATQGPLGWSAARTARRLGLPVSTSYHTHFDAYSSHYGLGWLQNAIAAHLRRFHNAADATLVPTRELAAHLKTQGYCNVSLMSRGVDTRLFNPERRSQELRAHWGIGPRGHVVAYVGRIAAEKNIDLVLRTFDTLHKTRPQTRLLFVGDGPLLPRLKAEHPEHLYAGLRRGEDLARHYASADLFLFPSLTETYGNVTAEALASGLGVVSYARAAAAELIEDGHNGFTVAPGDEVGFIQSATELLIHPTLLTRFRLRAMASMSVRSWDQVIDQFVATLRPLIPAADSRQTSVHWLTSPGQPTR